MMKCLLTGGCGFAGHHFAEHILKTTDWDVVIFDKLTYASRGLDRLSYLGDYDPERLQVFTVDISKPISEGVKREVGKVDYILHVAGETHVDRSIVDPYPFIEANIIGTYNMLQYAREVNPKKFLYFSTDEVFGPAPGTTLYKEWDRYNSGNPYAATKAGAEELVLAFGNTYKLPIIITHTMNLFGECQHPEKFIPLIVRKVLAGEPVKIHSNKDKAKAGTRFYIHCRNAAAALMFILKEGKTQDKYNIVGEKEIDNLALAQFIAKVIGKPLKYEMVDFHSSRPGHDLRYGLDGTKLKEMGWVHPKTFEDSLTKTIQWTLEHPEWYQEENDD